MKAIQGLGVLGFFFASHAWAGDIYSCKTAQGTVYQNTPCAHGATTAGHSTYSNDLGRPSAVPAYGPAPAERSPGSAPAYRDTTAVAGQGPQPTGSAEAAGYVCTSGNRRWMQKDPCPESLPGSRAVMVNGFTTTGQPINGTGVIAAPRPVQQQTISRDEACREMNKGTQYGHRMSDASQAYERNKLRSQYGC